MINRFIINNKSIYFTSIDVFVTQTVNCVWHVFFLELMISQQTN